MGYIIIVVAVLLNQRLKNPVDMMKPNIILFPLVPVFLMRFRAIRLCNFHFSIAIPIKNPPINKKMMESAYDLVTSLMGLISKSGNKMIGNNATTARGSASKIHQLIINDAMAKTILALGKSARGFIKKKKRNNRTPVIKAICFL